MSSKKRALELKIFVDELFELYERYDVVMDTEFGAPIGVIDLEHERDIGNGDFVEQRTDELYQDLIDDIDLNTEDCDEN